MDAKTLGVILLVAGLVVGSLGGAFSVSPKVNDLNNQINKLTTQVVATENLKNQLIEVQAQLEKLNVNELYGLVKIGDSTKAYKIGDMNKMPPLIANDVIGTTPVVVSWCPLCGSLTAYKRSLADGTVLTFQAAGARKIPGTDIENLHLKDEETGSLWAQGPGLAVEGFYEGQELESIPIQLFNEDVITKMGVDVWSP